MASLARSVDRVVGALSRFLHVRGPRVSTAGDISPYLGAPREVLFPGPEAPADMTRHGARNMRAPGRVVETLKWTSLHAPLCPNYRVRHAREYACNQQAVARWIHPREGPRRRALIYVHGWLEPGPWVEETFLLPRLYSELEVDPLHLQLPFHGSRNPKGALFHGEFFWTADLVRSFEAVRQSCFDARALVAWLRAEGYAEVGVTRFSMGGSIAMVLACLEPTPDYIIPIVGHLQLAEAIEQAPIFWRMKRDLERFGVDRAARARIFAGVGLERLRPVLPPARQLWIMARDDLFVPPPAVLRQWRAWGSPRLEWIPGGHTTFPLSLVGIVERMRRFHEGLQS